MKLTTFLLIIALIQVRAEAYCQSIKLGQGVDSIKSVGQLFSRIEEVSEFRFLYATDQINLDRKILLKKSTIDLSNVLNSLFRKSDIGYKVVGRQIILKKSDPEKAGSNSLLPGVNIASKNSSEISFIQHQVSGIITDVHGRPLDGASILEKGTGNGGKSDAKGHYSLSVESGDAILVISYLGLLTKEVNVNGKSTVNVALEETSAELDNVVVVGYGTVRKRDLTGSVSIVDPKSFDNQSVTRVDEALQGRAAGVSVSRTSGAPGSPIKVRIRGTNSITGSNDPLVVVDGIIGGDLSAINPNDVASINILKDASASAIYGVRGSNGVIIITTKKGSGKSKIDVDFFTTISKVPRFLPTLAESMEDFTRLENLRRTNTGGNPIYSNDEIAALKASGGTNYQKEIFHTGISSNIQLSASGSEGKLGYFISGNYRDEEGIVITTGYKQISLRSNLNAEISDRFTVGLNIYGSKPEAKGGWASIYRANTWDPTTPIFDAEGNYNIYSIKGVASVLRNPVYTLRESDISNIGERLNTALNLNYKITDHLDFNVLAGAALNNSDSQRYLVDGGSNEIPDVEFSAGKSTSYQMSNALTWQKGFGVHNIKVTGVQEYSKSTNTTNDYGAQDLMLPNGFYFAELAPNTGLTIGNDFNKRELSSYMLRGEYRLGDDLFATVTGRYDGTSVFRSGEKWGFFPSVALAYSFTDFVENSAIMNAMKLRVGWGRVGNQGINPYGTFATLAIKGYAYDGVSTSPGTFISDFANADLTWETTTQTNLGVDLGFLNSRLNISIDAYKKKTTNLLLLVPVALTNGGGNTLQNAGEVENFGFDFTGGYDIIDHRDLKLNSNFNVSYVKNKVVSLYGGVKELPGQFYVPDGTGRMANFIQVGQPLGQFNGVTFLGTWKSYEAEEAAKYNKSPGDAKHLRDEDGEDLYGAIGNGSPKIFWGWNNTLTYKNLELNIFLQGMNGFDVYNLMRAGITGGSGDRSFMSPEQVNQWTPTNETDIPATAELYSSSRYIEKGDFIRLSNLNIGYTFRNIVGIKSIKLYAAGQNLFLITGYSGYDPENTSGSSNLDQAPSIDSGAFPTPRTYTLGLRVGF